MVFFNYTTMQMTAKIVYYGPGLCGKTTNLQHIHHKTAPKSRGEMVSLETETDRTLFFDLLPLDVGVIGGMKVRLQLYTVPGQVFYNATRKLVLKGVDGIVYVADSQSAMLDANVESLKNLHENLAELNTGMDQIPVVFQYNKRDIRNIVPVERMNEVLNPEGRPCFEAAALHGIGVFETLKEISRLAITSVRKKTQMDDPRKKAAPAPAPAPPAPVPEPEPVAAAPASEPAVEAPAPPPDVPAAPAEIASVEFAEEDAERHVVRPVKTKGQFDITAELAGLRTLTSGSGKAVKAVKAKVDQRLDDLLGSRKPAPAAAGVEIRKKAAIEVPAGWLRESGSLSLQLTFGGNDDERVVRDAIVVTLEPGKKADRVSLHLDLDIKTKT